MSMTSEHAVFSRFAILYAALFTAFGSVSPFLPAFLAGRGLGPEELGIVLGAGTAVRTHLRALCRTPCRPFSCLPSSDCGLRRSRGQRRARIFGSPPLLGAHVGQPISGCRARTSRPSRGRLVTRQCASRTECGRIRVRMGAGRGLGCVRRRYAAGGTRSRYLWLLRHHLAQRDVIAVDPDRRELRACISRESNEAGLDRRASTSSLVDAASPASVCARHFGRRARSGQSCDV